MVENSLEFNVDDILEFEEEADNRRLSVSSTSSSRSVSIRTAQKAVMQKVMTLTSAIKDVINAACNKEVSLRLLTYVNDIEVNFQNHINQLTLKIIEPLQPIPGVNLELAKVIADNDPVKIAGEKDAKLLINHARSTLSEFLSNIKSKLTNINDMAVIEGAGNWFDHEKRSFAKLLCSIGANENSLQN